jgi:hypothetical protein
MVQGNKKYEDISSVDMTINVRGNMWEIEIEMGEIETQRLSKDWQKKQMFWLHVESTAMKDKVPLIETITGEMIVTEMKLDSLHPCRVKGISSNIHCSSKEGFVREKVQFT